MDESYQVPGTYTLLLEAVTGSCQGKEGVKASTTGVLLSRHRLAKKNQDTRHMYPQEVTANKAPNKRLTSPLLHQVGHALPCSRRWEYGHTSAHVGNAKSNLRPPPDLARPTVGTYHTNFGTTVLHYYRG